MGFFSKFTETMRISKCKHIVMETEQTMLKFRWNHKCHKDVKQNRQK